MVTVRYALSFKRSQPSFVERSSSDCRFMASVYLSRSHAVYLLWDSFPPRTLRQVRQRRQCALHPRTDVAPTFRLFEPIVVVSGTIRTSYEFDEWLFFTSLFQSSSKKRTLCDPLQKAEYLTTIHSLTARRWIWGLLRVADGPTSVSYVCPTRARTSL
jgi:hypothetical protein